MAGPNLSRRSARSGKRLGSYRQGEPLGRGDGLMATRVAVSREEPLIGANLNAERAVLASFLVGSPDAPLAFERLSAVDFFERRHAIVFVTLQQLHAKQIPTNEISILLNFVGDKLGDEFETALFLSQLISGVPKSRKENIEFYCERVRRASQHR